MNYCSFIAKLLYWSNSFHSMCCFWLNRRKICWFQLLLMISHYKTPFQLMVKNMFYLRPMILCLLDILVGCMNWSKIRIWYTVNIVLFCIILALQTAGNPILVVIKCYCLYLCYFIDCLCNVRVSYECRNRMWAEIKNIHNKKLELTSISSNHSPA